MEVNNNKAKYIWNYDEDGVFISKTVPNWDPMAPGEILIPARATTTEPPKCSKGNVLVYVEDEWRQVPDTRGPIYNIETAEEAIQTRVQPVPAGFTTKRKPKGNYIYDTKKDEWVIDETKTQFEKIASAFSKYMELCSSKIQIKNTHIIPDTDLMVYLNIFLTTSDTSITILDMDMNPVVLSQEEAQDLVNSVYIRKQQLIKKFATKKKNIEA